MNDENTVESEPDESTSSPVLILPGHLFFAERIELPAALEVSDLNDFAELSLENLAPFPVEQLFWGFLYSAQSESIFLYASYKGRVKAMGFDDLESYLWVLPDFATLFGTQFPEDTRLLLETEGAFTQVNFPAEDILPKQIISRLPDDSRFEKQRESSDIRFVLGSTGVSEGGLPSFSFEITAQTAQNSSNELKKITPDEDTLWRADVRDQGFKESERSARKLTARVARVTAYAAVFAALLIAMEAILFLGNFWQESRAAKIAEQAPEILRIEDKQSLMNKLDQVAQNELRPVAILEALNVSRPEGIYFTETVAEGQNRIIVEGIAGTINELNSYTDALTASGKFELLEDPKVLSRGGKTTFSATLDYLHSENPTTEDQSEKEG